MASLKGKHYYGVKNYRLEITYWWVDIVKFPSTGQLHLIVKNEGENEEKLACVFAAGHWAEVFKASTIDKMPLVQDYK